MHLQLLTLISSMPLLCLRSQAWAPPPSWGFQGRVPHIGHPPTVPPTYQTQVTSWSPHKLAPSLVFLFLPGAGQTILAVFEHIEDTSEPTRRVEGIFHVFLWSAAFLWTVLNRKNFCTRAYGDTCSGPQLCPRCQFRLKKYFRVIPTTKKKHFYSFNDSYLNHGSIFRE